MSVPPTPASCDFGSASCTHSGLVFIDQGSVSLTFEEHCLGPLVCVLQHEAGGCVCVCTCVCVCVCAHTPVCLSVCLALHPTPRVEDKPHFKEKSSVANKLGARGLGPLSSWSALSLLI